MKDLKTGVLEARWHPPVLAGFSTLIGWLQLWLAGYKSDWLAATLTGWLQLWLAGCNSDWLAIQLWLTGCNSDWLAIQLWLTGCNSGAIQLWLAGYNSAQTVNKALIGQHSFVYPADCPFASWACENVFLGNFLAWEFHVSCLLTLLFSQANVGHARVRNNR